MDRRMHVYGVRVKPAVEEDQRGVYEIDNQRLRVSLVELDTNLEEVQDWPLDDYRLTGTTDSEGITGYCELSDGSIVFVAKTGALWKISLSQDRAVSGTSAVFRLKGKEHPISGLFLMSKNSSPILSNWITKVRP